MKIYSILVLSLSSVLMGACSDFTDVGIPDSRLAGDAVFKDQSTATSAMLDVYARMRETGFFSGGQDGLSLLMGVYADELDYFGGSLSPTEGFSNHALIPSNESVSSLWTTGYAHIYGTNAVVEGLGDSPWIAGEVRNQLLGEALFIRALLHFHLVNLYGGIPYIKETDYRKNSVVPKESIASVYQQIVDDLAEAKRLLPVSYIHPERTRINRPAVQALLARVYLYQEAWGLAESEASDVIDHRTLYAIETGLDSAYLMQNPSTIWQLHPGVDGANANEGRLFIFTSGPPAIVSASEGLVDAFDGNDLRRRYWLKDVTNGTASWAHAYKYKENVNTGTSKEYSIILRLEEQYLIRAEARARLDKLTGSQEDLNVIRNRAGLGNTTANTRQELLAAVMSERRLELFMEVGHRWFDLKRTGQAESVLSAIKPGWHERSLLLPLPEKELVLNSNLLPQNFGY